MTKKNKKDSTKKCYLFSMKLLIFHQRKIFPKKEYIDVWIYLICLHKRKGRNLMKVQYIKEDKLLILKITEEIDHHSCEKIKKRADYEIQIHIPKKVIFDFGNVNFMDSSGIGMVIGRYKLISMFGGKTTMINVKPAIKKVLEMSGVLKLIPIEKIEELGGQNFEECV